ncbi:MAG: hypothetical protein ACI389_02435 [Methanobrevibacter sp.]
MDSEIMKRFDENVKQQLETADLIDAVLEIGWNYLQAKKEGVLEGVE